MHCIAAFEDPTLPQSRVWLRQHENMGSHCCHARFHQLSVLQPARNKKFSMFHKGRMRKPKKVKRSAVGLDRSASTPSESKGEAQLRLQLTQHWPNTHQGANSPSKPVMNKVWKQLLTVMARYIKNKQPFE